MHILCIGAHPDDCDISVGGTAALLARQGHRVKFVAVTNGDRGHMDRSLIHDRSPLAARRLAEARNAVAVFGGEYECLDVHDGEVYVTRELTEAMVRVIRQWGEKPGQGPDLVLLNRTNDYHRDHRYTAQVVLDATFMLMVPLMCPETPALRRMPVFAYWFDSFREGGAFQPDVVVPVDRVMETKACIVAQHASQVFEWLPYVTGAAAAPADATGRLRHTLEWLQGVGHGVADACRGHIPADCQYAEAFQISEYGRRPADDELRRLFPSP
jgi:LmbE family N-acetylglucosaminyl deacetylase